MGDFVFAQHRAEASLSLMHARFSEVAMRVQAVYRLRLPRHLAVFAAFLDAIDEAGRSALSDCVGLSAGGISRYFEHDGLALAGRNGLDERLEARFRCDPPEFVTVMWGDTDGLHFGLWYDDPAELPSFVAYNYARDSAETWTSHQPTVLAEIAERIDRAAAEMESDPDEEYPGQEDLPELRRALEAFGEADRKACKDDGPLRWAATARPAIVGGLGPALPSGAGDPRGGGEQREERSRAYHDRSPLIWEWVAQAEAELGAGKPAFALTLGRELHWVDSDDYRDASLRLLTSAYRALGRDALADIAEVHHAHRDLHSVAVLGRS